MQKARTNTVMMVKPINFRYNEETAENNAFQNQPDKKENSQELALNEFNVLVQKLKMHNINVHVVNDTNEFDTPDSIFPNNWISLHQDGTLSIYPMFAPNRRNEVRLDIVDQLVEKYNYNEILNWSHLANDTTFLEGTGSLVLDRKNRTAYGCISDRTNEKLAKRWAKTMNYQLDLFTSVDRNGFPIYHTNVMMAIAEDYAVACLESIVEENERNQFVKLLEASGKEVIEIEYYQMEQFAGNMLELANEKDESIMVMSEAALNSLTEEQKNKIEAYSIIVSAPIPTIEKNGGGSVRCMITEVFAPVN